MTIRSFRPRFHLLAAPGLCLLLASCAVDRPASLIRGAAPAGEEPVVRRGGFFQGGRKAEPDRIEVTNRAAVARGLAREKAEKAALSRQRQAEQAAAELAEMREWEAIAAANRRDREARREAKRAARQGISFRPFAPRPDVSEVAVAEAPRERGGFFSRPFFGGKARRSASQPSPIYVDHEQIHALEPSNAAIEISLAEQRARVFRKQGTHRTLVIETPVSTGKSGFETPTGRFTIGEKLEEKQSTLYGIWYDAAGQPVPSSGESHLRPPGGVNFVGAEMPYWMRLIDGIGMHIGEVPGHPASHGCIRVPPAIQPLIFSKVGIGTPVTISH